MHLTARIAGIGALALAHAIAIAETPPGLSLAPPIPVASRPYSITINSVAYGPPVSVTNAITAVHGSFIDTTLYLDHGSGYFTPAPFQTVSPGPPLPSGFYTFRYFTADKYPGDMTYGPVSEIIDSGEFYVTGVQNVGDAVEYYNAARDHYFTTAHAGEIALLDAGFLRGWARTGERLAVYLYDPSAVGIPPELSPVCRYYGLPMFGLDTHFFSASAYECAVITAKWPDQWILETRNAFYVYMPYTNDGSCPLGTVPVYRLYDNRPDANHRYTTSFAIRQQMIDAGWIPEGYGNLSVGMCVIAS